jgi:hypothetical protein
MGLVSPGSLKYFMRPLRQRKNPMRHNRKTRAPLSKHPAWQWVTLLILGLLLAIASAGTLMVSNYFGSDAFRLRTQALINQQTQWNVTCQQIHLGLWPAPHADATQVVIRIPDTGTITSDSLEVYPRLGMLLVGKVQVKQVRILAPVIQISLPAQQPAASQPRPAAAPAPVSAEILLEQRIIPALKRFAAYFQNGLVLIEGGALRVESGGQLQVDLNRFNLRLEVPTRGLRFTCSYWANRLKREVAFSGLVLYGQDRITFQELAGQYGPSSFSGLSGHLQWNKDPGLWVQSGSFKLGMNVLLPILAQIKSQSEVWQNLSGLKLQFQITSARVRGPLADPKRWQIEAAGQVDNLSFQSLQLPGQTRIVSGSFALRQGMLRLTDVRATLRDSTLLLSAAVPVAVGADLSQGGLSLSGSIGPKSMERLQQGFGLPPQFLPKAPLKITTLQIQWKKQGPTKVTADLAWRDQLKLTLSGSFAPNDLRLERLTLKDPLERMDFSLRLTPKVLDFSFAGRSSTELFNRMFIAPVLEKVTIAGDLKVHVPRDKPAEFLATGKLEAANLLVPLPDALPIQIETLRLVGKEEELGVELGNLSLGDTRLSAQGSIQGSLQGVIGHLSVNAQNVAVDDLLNTVNALSAAAVSVTTPSAPAFPWQLDVDALSAQASFHGFRFTAVQTQLELTPEVVALALSQADMCGIGVSGTVRVQNNRITVNLVPAATQQDLEKTLRCQFGEDLRMTGLYDVSGRITGEGPGDTILDHLQGGLKAEARNGRIYKMTSLSRALSVINVTEVFFGTMPQLDKEGVGYSQFRVLARVKRGRLVLEEAVLRANNMDLTGKGSFALADGEMNLTILVAPFKTMNRIVGSIPVVNYIFDDTLVAFPFEVTGTLGAPKVVSAVPAKADQGVYGIMKRTVLLPVHIASPLFPPGGEQSQDQPVPVSITAAPDAEATAPESGLEPPAEDLPEKAAQPTPEPTQPEGAPSPAAK